MTYIKSIFLLDPKIIYLNHGSFGACPKPIFDDYQKWQRLLEEDPVNFMVYKCPLLLKKSREELSKYLNCHSDDIVFTTNPSYAANIIAKSIHLEPGDEILTTNMEYGAMDRTWKYYCKKKRAKYIRQTIPLPITSKEHFLEHFLNGLNKKTKVIFISHITSSTALILPVEEICKISKERGVLCIIDGAHVPGHIHLDIKTLDPDIYIGACHKWMLTPKGSSFLYVKKDIQERFDPLTISWGYESDQPSHSRFIDYHEYQGTRDFSAFLTLPKAIEFLHNNRWVNVSSSCKDLIKNNYDLLCDLVDTSPICPVHHDYLGQMCSIYVKTQYEEELKSELYNKYRIQIPVMKNNEQTFIRVSVQGYNSQEEIDQLVYALKEIRQKSKLLE